MHAISFIQDLAVVMLVAGIVTVLFHRFKQPVVLGYIIAGVILGPYTPPFQLIQDELTIKTLAELGMLFLMFSLGLEFSMKKLARVGGTALIAALSEIALMIWIGYEIGGFFGWSTMDSLFLGAILAISSTTIIIKALDELGMKRERFAQMIFGILIVEDILAIGIIALLSAIATSGSVTAGTVFGTIGQLSLFMVVALVLGILIVPRLLAFVAKFESKEMLLVTVLGILFGFCLLVTKLDYSIALGAFVIGAVMAESRQLLTIETLIEPIRDMFSAIFFVTIGLLLDPQVLVTYAVPVAVITVAVVIGKVFSCSLGTFLSGNDGRTSMRVGMGLAQIGEFSFIIASLGVTLNVTSNFLYPIAVAVSAVTTLLTPYLIKLADPLTIKLGKVMPKSVTRVSGQYTAWLENMKPKGDKQKVARIIQRIVFQVLVNCALVAAVFLAGAYVGSNVSHRIVPIASEDIQNTVILAMALLVSLPFLIAAYRKLQALSMLLEELAIKLPGGKQSKARRVISEVIPVASILGIALLITFLSATILPPVELLVPVLLAAAFVAVVLWKWFVKLHSKLQGALIKTLQDKTQTEI
ncbi:MAG: cation:proton antiporter [Bacteroidota bacterium]